MSISVVEGNREREDRERVLIAGGGVAALEAALALRELAGERLAIELCSPRGDFVYRPFAVGEPYGAASILRYDLDTLAARIGVSFRLGGIFSVDPAARTATVRDGDADPLRPPAGRLRRAHALGGARARSPSGGSPTKAASATSCGGCAAACCATSSSRCPAATAGRCRCTSWCCSPPRCWPSPGSRDARLRVVTPEDAPLELFGRAVGVEMGELLRERGIEVIGGVHPVAYEDGRLSVAPGDPIATEAVVSLPRLEGRRIDGLPTDPEGFLLVDEHCRVAGARDVYAAGDVTSFPVKQGGIATQEADVAAEAIAAAAGIEIEPAAFDPVLRGTLWTGEEPRYLYGRPAGGHGEVSKLSREPLWPEPDGKIVGRFLSPFLDGTPDVARRTVSG